MQSVTHFSFPSFVYQYLDPFIKGTAAPSQPSISASQEIGACSAAADSQPESVLVRGDSQVWSHEEEGAPLLAFTQKVSTASLEVEEGMSPFLQLVEDVYGSLDLTAYKQLRDCYVACAIDRLHRKHAFRWVFGPGRVRCLDSVLHGQEKKEHCERVVSALERALLTDFQGADSSLSDLPKEEIARRVATSLDNLYQKELVHVVRSLSREGEGSRIEQSVEKMGFSLEDAKFRQFMKKEAADLVGRKPETTEIDKKELMQEMIENVFSNTNHNVWERIVSEWQHRFKESPDRFEVMDQCIAVVCNHKGPTVGLRLGQGPNHVVQGLSPTALQEAFSTLEKEVSEFLSHNFPQDDRFEQYKGSILKKIENWIMNLYQGIAEDQSHLSVYLRYRDCCLKQTKANLRSNPWLDLKLIEVQSGVLASLKPFFQSALVSEQEKIKLFSSIESDYFLYTVECIYKELSLLHRGEKLKELVLQRVQSHLMGQSIKLSEDRKKWIDKRIEQGEREKASGIVFPVGGREEATSHRKRSRDNEI